MFPGLLQLFLCNKISTFIFCCANHITLISLTWSALVKNVTDDAKFDQIIWCVYFSAQFFLSFLLYKKPHGWRYMKIFKIRIFRSFVLQDSKDALKRCNRPLLHIFFEHPPMADRLDVRSVGLASSKPNTTNIAPLAVWFMLERVKVEGWNVFILSFLDEWHLKLLLGPPYGHHALVFLRNPVILKTKSRDIVLFHDEIHLKRILLLEFGHFEVKGILLWFLLLLYLLLLWQNPHRCWRFFLYLLLWKNVVYSDGSYITVDGSPWQ